MNDEGVFVVGVDQGVFTLPQLPLKSTSTWLSGKNGDQIAVIWCSFTKPLPSPLCQTLKVYSRN